MRDRLRTTNALAMNFATRPASSEMPFNGALYAAWRKKELPRAATNLLAAPNPSRLQAGRPDGPASGHRPPVSLGRLAPSSPLPGKVSRPESGHSFRLPVCCLTNIGGRPRISCEQPDIFEPDTEWFCCIGMALGRQKAESLGISHVGLQRSPVSVLHSVGRRAADRQT